MTLTIHFETVPITLNADGIALVGYTRVRLETVIAAFRLGDTPEQIVDSFDVLALADVYAVIAYYLRYQAEVDAYIAERQATADAIRHRIEHERPDMLALQRRLTERKRRRSS